ncbi:MAG: helix-turn-helix domain-containing protein, partial [Coprococcus phoceensis]
MSFGTRLRDKRKELGITQPQLAEILGVSQSAIGSWETDTNSPRATLLYDLFDILHCDANYLFQDETKELYKDKATPSEFENIIKKYRDLDDHGKEMVDFTL